MNSILTFDEMNRLGKARRSMSFDDYFDVMDLEQKDIDRRKKLANELFDILLFFFTEIENDEQFDPMSYSAELTAKFLYALNDSEIEEDGDAYKRVYDVVDEILIKILENPDDDWYTSEDRAMFDAENESQTTFNLDDNKKAHDSGKNMKEWCTMRDERVRGTHVEADYSVKQIDEPFIVGGYEMMFPKDSSLGAGPEEIINCRCTVRYFTVNNEVKADNAETS